MSLPSGIPGEKNYDQDYDPNYKYFKEWKGIVYDEKTETQMLHVMREMEDADKVFATPSTYLYYARYYKMLGNMQELRRKKFVESLKIPMEDPLRYKTKFKAGNPIANLSLINTSLGVGGIGVVLFLLRFLRK